MCNAAAPGASCSDYQRELIQEGGGRQVRCPKCDATDCISIEIHLASDDPLQFFSCRHCEARWWQRDGQSVSLEEVLSLAAKKDPR